MGNNKKSLTRAEEKHLREENKKALEAQAKKNQELIEKYMKADPKHKMPTTRRQFLEAGILSASGYMLAPTLSQLVGKLEAAAAECPVPNVAAGPAPFVHLHYSGGFQTLAAITPRNTNGDRINNYAAVGLGSTPTFDTAFSTGNDVYNFAADRGFIAGVRRAAQESTIAATACITIPYRDNGDSDDPPFSGLGLIEASQRKGLKLGNLSNQNSPTGIGAQNPAFNISATTPLRVGSVQNILDAVQLAGALTQLNAQQQLSLANKIKSLSAAQARRLTGFSGGANILDLVECAADQTVKNLQNGAGGLDPRQIAGYTQIWNNFQNDQVNNANGGNVNNTVLGSMVYNVLNDNAAACAYEVGGYDIHNEAGNGRANQEGGAFKIGLTVGRILESARFMNKKVFIQLTTNGSNNCAGGLVTDPFNSDSSDYSGVHVFAYDPTRVTAATSGQIGGLQGNGSTDRNIFTSNVANGIGAMFYNYCLFSGDEAMFERALPGRFSAEQKAQVARIVKV